MISRLGPGFRRILILVVLVLGSLITTGVIALERKQVRDDVWAAVRRNPGTVLLAVNLVPPAGASWDPTMELRSIRIHGIDVPEESAAYWSESGQPASGHARLANETIHELTEHLFESGFFDRARMSYVENSEPHMRLSFFVRDEETESTIAFHETFRWNRRLLRILTELRSHLSGEGAIQLDRLIQQLQIHFSDIAAYRHASLVANPKANAAPAPGGISMTPWSNFHAMRVILGSLIGLLFGPHSDRSLARGTVEDGVQVVIGNWLDGESEIPPSPAPSPLSGPFGIDFTPNDLMVVVEYEGGRVLTFDESTGSLETLAGRPETGFAGDGGPALDAVFNCMHNVVVDADSTIYISDTLNHVVRRIEPGTQLVQTFAGTGRSGFSGDGGPCDQAEFHDIMCVSLDRSRGRLLLADIQNRRIRGIDLGTKVVSTVAGNGRKGVPENGGKAIESPLVDPRASVADADGNVYVIERGGHALRVVGSDGSIRTVAGDGTAGFVDGPARLARLNSPKHLDIDESGRVYIADDENAAIRRYDPRTNRMETLLGRGYGHPRVRLLHPHGVRVRGDDLYVVDTRNDRIIRVVGAAVAP